MKAKTKKRQAGQLYRKIEKMPDGTRTEYREWRGRYTDENGRRIKVKLFADKRASQDRLNELVADSELRRAGVLTPAIEHAAKPLAEHVTDYVAWLEGENLDADHLRITRWTMGKLLELGGWQRLSDITPDSVQRIVGTLRQQKKTVSYCNKFIARAKAFSNWLAKRGRVATNALAGVRKPNEEKAEKRRGRRPLTREEIAALLDAAPPQRAAVYQFLLVTGLRRSELADLQWGDLRLDNDQPFIQLRAEQTKNGRADQMQLHPALVEWLREQPRGTAAARVFRSIPDIKTLKKDLKAAGVAFVDEQGRRADLHSLRHTFCRLVAQSGATVKEAQKLMRHADPKLTLGVYMHAGILETARALANVRLPLPAAKPMLTCAGTTPGPKLFTIGQSAAPLGTTTDAATPGMPATLTLPFVQQGSGFSTDRHPAAQPDLMKPHHADIVTKTGPSTQVD